MVSGTSQLIFYTVCLHEGRFVYSVLSLKGRFHRVALKVISATVDLVTRAHK